jgi:outer membrane cobalamin receptor
MKSIIYIGLLFLSGIFFIGANVLADDSGNESTDEEVVVTATRTGQSAAQSPGVTEVTSKETIENSGKSTVAEVVAGNGINIATNGGISGVAMVQLDGSTAEQTLVLVNGIAANTGCAGSVDLSCFPVAGIQKIETVHGPLSSLYGANALGGVVNIITDLTGAPQNQVLLGDGSFNSRNLGVNFQQKKWGLACGANFSDGFRERTKTDGSFLMAQYNFSDSRDKYLKLYWQATARTTEAPGSISWPLPDAAQNDQNFSLNLNGKSSLFQGVWEYKVFAQYLDVKYYEYSIPYRHQTLNSGFDCAGLYTTGSHEFLTGLTYKHQYSDSSIDEQHALDTGGLYLQDSWFMSDKVSLVTGVRYDYCTNFPAPLSPRINLGYAVDPDFTIKCGYGRAFRAPTMNELYWNQPEYGMIGNQNLKPEEGDRYDLIGVWKKGAGSLTVNLYQSNMINGIRWVTEDYITYTVDNVAKVQTNGININWEKTWGEFITVKAGYHGLDEWGWDEGTQSYSNDLNTFGDQMDLGFGLQFKVWGCRLGWKFAGNRNNQTPDYNTGSLSLNYRPNKVLTWVLAVDNLTNQSYQIVAGYPMPGIDVTLHMNYTF